MNIILTTEETKKNRERDCSFVPFMRMVYCDFFYKNCPSLVPLSTYEVFSQFKKCCQ